MQLYFLPELSPFTIILAMFRVKERGLWTAFFFLEHIKKLLRGGIMIFGQAAASSPSFLGHISISLGWSAFLFLVQVQARKHQEKQLFYENQTSLMKAGATDLHIMPILTFRWVK